MQRNAEPKLRTLNRLRGEGGGFLSRTEACRQPKYNVPRVFSCYLGPSRKGLLAALAGRFIFQKRWRAFSGPNVRFLTPSQARPLQLNRFQTSFRPLLPSLMHLACWIKLEKLSYLAAIIAEGLRKVIGADFRFM